MVVANKRTAETDTLMLLARAFQLIPTTKVMNFETFPKLINEFDETPYIFISD